MRIGSYLRTSPSSGNYVSRSFRSSIHTPTRVPLRSSSPEGSCNGLDSPFSRDQDTPESDERVHLWGDLSLLHIQQMLVGGLAARENELNGLGGPGRKTWLGPSVFNTDQSTYSA